MKIQPSKAFIVFISVTLSVAMTNCQSPTGVHPTPSVVVTPTKSASAEIAVPTPSSTLMVKPNGTNNPFDSFPYEKVDDFAEVKSVKLSGVVFHPQRQTLFAVGDEGWMIEIKPDGAVIQTKQIRKKADFEGITYNPATEMLYIAVEGDEVILEVNAESFEVLRDIPIDRMFEGEVLIASKGEGIEGITFVPAGADAKYGTFYLVNQSKELEGADPSIVFEVEVSNVADTPVARIVRHFSVGITDLSGIHYVPSSRRLLIISDANDLLLVVSLSGEILKTYPLPGKKQEGVTVDTDGFLYIAQDTKKELLKFKPKSERVSNP